MHQAVAGAEVADHRQPGGGGELQQPARRGVLVAGQWIKAAFLPGDRQQHEWIRLYRLLGGVKGTDDVRGDRLRAPQRLGINARPCRGRFASDLGRLSRPAGRLRGPQHWAGMMMRGLGRVDGGRIELNDNKETENAEAPVGVATSHE